MAFSGKTGSRVGPWGGDDGFSWDDGCHGGVREILLDYSSTCIVSIRVVYDKHGKPVLGDRHGGDGNYYAAQIRLNYPEEYLTTIRGYYSNLWFENRVQRTVIRSLWFRTNLRTFGPFGQEDGEKFELPLDESKVVGFTGRSGSHLHAIGCVISPVHTQKVLNKLHRRIHKKVEDFTVRMRPHAPVA